MPRQRKLPSGLSKRGTTYYARCRVGGRMIQKRLSTDFDTACTLLNELKARADRGDFGLLDNDCSWDELKAEFLRWARQSMKGKGAKQYESDLRRFESFLKVQSIRQLSPAVAMSYREFRLSQAVTVRTRKDNAAPLSRKVCPRTVNREIGTIINMLNRGVAWGRIGSNPLSEIKPLTHDKPVKQRRALTTEEVERLFETSPEYLRPVWRMFASTGMRLAEIADLRFSDIDFDRQAVTVRPANAKSKKSREIPLDDELFAMLQGVKEAACDRGPGASPDHVFVTTNGTPHRTGLLKLFYACCRRAGIEDAVSGGSVDLHSLRVSFATLALENGASPKAVQAILGHSTLQMTMNVYAKATERAKRDAISALPFAKSTAPQHVIPVQNVRTVCPSKKTSTQGVESQAVAMLGG
jgi:integrase